MRFVEFTEQPKLDRLFMILKNQIGRAKSKGAPVALSWDALSALASSSGFEIATDYETFKHLYDTNPALKALVHNFNSQGIRLKVPGVSDKQQDVSKNKKSSRDTIDKIAKREAPKQVSKSQQTPST
jgi:hypothetical protein